MTLTGKVFVMYNGVADVCQVKSQGADKHSYFKRKVFISNIHASNF